MSARRSAGLLGVSLFSVSFAKINASIALRLHSALATLGTAGRALGWYAQYALVRALICVFGRFSGASLPAISCLGLNGAPIFTHCVRISIDSCGSFSFGGISWFSSLYEIIWSNRLCSGALRLMAGPISPPFNSPARLVMRKCPLSRFSLPWHLKQFSLRIAKTFWSKN